MGSARPSVMISHLYKELDTGVRKLIKDIPRGNILCVVIVVVNYISQVDYAFDIQFIRCINQAVNCSVHNVSAVFYRILCIRNQNDIIIVLIFQSVAFIASVLSQILLRILHKPLAFIQASFGDSYFLKIALKELVQRLSAFLPPAGSDTETAVFRICVQTFHIIGNIITECLASVYICTDLMSVGSNGNVIPYTAFIHCYGPCRVGHHVAVVLVCRNKLYLFTV